VSGEDTFQKSAQQGQHYQEMVGESDAIKSAAEETDAALTPQDVPKTVDVKKERNQVFKVLT